MGPFIKEIEHAARRDLVDVIFLGIIVHDSIVFYIAVDEIPDAVEVILIACGLVHGLGSDEHAAVLIIPEAAVKLVKFIHIIFNIAFEYHTLSRPFSIPLHDAFPQPRLPGRVSSHLLTPVS